MVGASTFAFEPECEEGEDSDEARARTGARETVERTRRAYHARPEEGREGARGDAHARMVVCSGAERVRDFARENTSRAKDPKRCQFPIHI